MSGNKERMKSDAIEMKLTTVRLLHYMQGLEEYRIKKLFPRVIDFLFYFCSRFKAAAYLRKFKFLLGKKTNPFCPFKGKGYIFVLKHFLITTY